MDIKQHNTLVISGGESLHKYREMVGAKLIDIASGTVNVGVFAALHAAAKLVLTGDAEELEKLK